jgi:hypothetical protein
VTVAGYDPKRKQVIVADPWSASARSIPEADFVRRTQSTLRVN